MTYLVAYDGGERSAGALRRAASLAAETGASLVVVSVLPNDDALAETYDLLEGGEYDPDAAAGRLRAAARDIAPGAAFRTEHVDAYAGKGRVADRLAGAAREEGADVVFVGSDGAGRIVTRLSRVADPPAGFDVFLVRSA